MVLTPPIVFAWTDGIVSVLLDHRRTRGQSVARMRDFLHSLEKVVWKSGHFYKTYLLVGKLFLLIHLHFNHAI